MTNSDAALVVVAGGSDQQPAPEVPSRDHPLPRPQEFPPERPDEVPVDEPQTPPRAVDAAFWQRPLYAISSTWG